MECTKFICEQLPEVTPDCLAIEIEVTLEVGEMRSVRHDDNAMVIKGNTMEGTTGGGKYEQCEVIPDCVTSEDMEEVMPDCCVEENDTTDYSARENPQKVMSHMVRKDEYEIIPHSGSSEYMEEVMPDCVR